MKRVVLTGIVLLVFQSAWAQVQRSYTQYYNHLQNINPAFVGMKNYWEFRAGYRQPWNDNFNTAAAKFAGIFGYLGNKSPLDTRSQSLRVSDPSTINKYDTRPFLRKHGVGAYFNSYENGPFNENIVQLNYAFHLPLTKRSFLSLGTSLNWVGQEVDFSKFTVRDDDEFFNALLANGDRRDLIRTQIGLAFYQERFYLGFSLRPAFEEVLSGNDLLTTVSAGDAFSLITGYQLRLSRHLRLHPTVIYHYSSVSEDEYQADIKMNIGDNVMIGALYSSQGIYSGLLELNLVGQLSIGYSYDYYTEDVSDLASGIHEVSLAIMFAKFYAKDSFLW